MDPRISILQAFGWDPAKELTINQLAKSIKKSYAYTNGHVWAMVGEGILVTKKVGPSLLCKVISANELARGWMAIVAALQKQEWMQQHPDKLAWLEIIHKFKDQMFFAVADNEKLIVVCREGILLHGDFSCLNKLSFKEYLKERGYPLICPIYGFEKFMEMIADA